MAVRFLPDTSVLVAAVCPWHQHHAAATQDLAQRLRRGDRMVLAEPSIVEAYAVLTRLPSPYRLAPADAHALLASNFLSGRKMVSLDDAGIRALLDRLVAEGIAGGQTYDAVIASCARRARVTVLLTFNESDFDPFAGDDLQIIVPGRPSV